MALRRSVKIEDAVCGRRGFSALFIVIILGAAALAVSLWLAAAGIWGLRESDYAKNSAQAREWAGSCAEIALETIRENKITSGNGGQSFSLGDCSWNVVDAGGDKRSIAAIGTITNFTWRLEIATQGFNPVKIVSWVEK